MCGEIQFGFSCTFESSPHRTFFLRACLQQVWFLCARNEILFARTHKQSCRKCNNTHGAAMTLPCAAHVVCPSCASCFNFESCSKSGSQFSRSEILSGRSISPTLFSHTAAVVALQNFILYSQPYWNAQHIRWSLHFESWTPSTKALCNYKSCQRVEIWFFDFVVWSWRQSELLFINYKGLILATYAASFDSSIVYSLKIIYLHAKFNP